MFRSAGINAEDADRCNEQSAMPCDKINVFDKAATVGILYALGYMSACSAGKMYTNEQIHATLDPIAEKLMYAGLLEHGPAYEKFRRTDFVNEKMPRYIGDASSKSVMSIADEIAERLTDVSTECIDDASVSEVVKHFLAAEKEYIEALTLRKQVLQDRTIKSIKGVMDNHLLPIVDGNAEIADLINSLGASVECYLWKTGEMEE